MPKVKINSFETEAHNGADSLCAARTIRGHSMPLVRRTACLLMVVLTIFGCTKDEPRVYGHVQVNLCLLNKTENDFKNDSYLELGIIKDRNLPKDQTSCWGQSAGGQVCHVSLLCQRRQHDQRYFRNQS